MVVFEISDIKNFMSLLFKGNSFDRFLIVEADVKMAVDYRIEGAINEAFFDTDEKLDDDGQNKRQQFARWETVKGTVFEIIKGKKLPLKLKVMLKKPVANEVDGQFSYSLNIMYENGKLQLVTNVTAVKFSLERPNGETWDNMIKNILVANNIALEIV